jgi:hypothetical protein
MNKHDEDEDYGKGAVEQDRPEQKTNTSMTGQMGHRDNPPIVDSQDSDYPEPVAGPEHSGELIQDSLKDEQQLDKEADEIADTDQDPGHRQKQNQNDEKDDPLAA